jgi:zinc protease
LRSLLVSLLSLSLMLGVIAPARSQVNGPGDAGVFETTLKNGLRVVVAEDHSAPVVQTAIWYGFGSLNETAGKTGLAHALEHMSFRGTDEISSGGLDDIVARMGARMNGETTYDYTQLYFTMPSDKIDVALGIESDRMAHLALRAQDWAVERGAVLNELDGDASSPFFDLLSRVREAAYPNQPTGRTPVGVRSDVANATVADIGKYYREWYAPNNATLVVAGDVDHAAVFAKAQRFFGSIPSRTLPAKPTTSPVAATGKTVEAAFPFPFEVLDLAYAIPGDTEAGEPAISTLATLIENQRGPFYQALVQTNIALGIEANADTQVRGGLLNVFIILNPGHTSDEAQRVYQTTMNQVLANGFDPELVTAAKRLTIAERIYSADSVEGLGSLAGYTYGIINEKIHDEDDRLAALTPADILATAKKYLSQPNVVGHLRPNDAPPKGNSQKSDAAASDDFSKRVPNGPVVVPAWIATAVRTPSTARSPLAPVSFTLSNGLRVLVQQKTDRPTFVLTGEIASSPAFAPPGKEGIVRLASSVADYGSESYPFELRRKTTDELGAFVTTGQGFSARGQTGDFEKIAAVVADGVAHPSFADPWFGIERSQLANSLQTEQTISGQMIDRAYDQLLLASDDPSLRQATPRSVNSITRDDLLGYAARYWRPDLTSIAVVGNLPPERVRAALEAAFASWKAVGPKPDAHGMAMPPASRGHDFIGTDSNQVYVRIGQPAVSRSNPDYDTFQVFNQILGGAGSFESRLWQELRQKRGLVYSVDSSLQATEDRGDFRVELNAGPQRVVEAVRLVRQELVRMQNEPVTQTELDEAKGRLVSDALLDEASTEGQAEQLLDIATYGLPIDYYRTLNERFARITIADVQRVAKTYIKPDRMVQVYAGPSGPWSSNSL